MRHAALAARRCQPSRPALRRRSFMGFVDAGLEMSRSLCRNTGWSSMLVRLTMIWHVGGQSGLPDVPEHDRGCAALADRGRVLSARLGPAPSALPVCAGTWRDFLPSQAYSI